ncbi:MAG: PorP/SprF family type IX secretion system membrane protein [Arcicella sp.]|nr:PorP/SprF family type IX secretion system membrane protein [Arcicella sp.]
MKYLLIFAVFTQSLIYSFSTKAQQDQMYITYPFMPLNINPAYAGSREVVSFTAVYRRRPLLGAVGVATTSQQYLTFDMPIAHDKMAIGFQAYNADQVFGTNVGGVYGNLGLYGDFAYRIQLPNDGKLAVGVQVGVTQVPAVLGLSGGANFNSSLGAGLYYHNDDAYVGVSLLNFNAEIGYNRPFFATAGYVFTIDDEFKIKTGALLRKNSNSAGGSTNIDLNATAWINDKFGIGVWYQNTGSEFSSTAYLGSFQVQLKKLQIGYAYDFSGGGNPSGVGGTANEGFHQIMFKYELDAGNGKSGVFKYF